MRNLQRSSAALSCFGYNLLRSIEFCCAWLPAVAACDGKMAMGREIGAYARMLESIERRLSELAGGKGWHGRAEDEEFFSALAATAHEDDAILAAAKALRARLSVLLGQLLHELRNSPHATIDEPTGLLLQSATACLGDAGADAPFDADAVYVAYRSDEILPPLVARPARESRLQLRTEPGGNWAEWIHSPEGRLDIIHEIFIEIEIPATEVCAMNIVLFRDAPLKFKLDMARQVWDEARHAFVALARYQELGGELGAKRYSENLWNHWSQGDDVVDRLCIQQVVQEGNALDSVSNLANVFRKAGDVPTADMFMFFAADEELHTRFGNDWALAFLGGDKAVYMQRVEAAAESIGALLPGRRPVNVPSRLRGGFPHDVVEDLVRRQAQRGA
ncbi:ferritin-like domain-containing protein [Marilutibacter chinensis]|uniref:Ferritin-like domain-containing protein n=1 Tax=Marilutibacter chinensis TaxID=2912247 RepID=A0ABS9HZZ1_9GAMM|nr:ferritin-like domain-containing protein [Lysobacter chinensis]MCF7223760.1 ferritin-like domain-containing protein [Lysobacter chinensis]